MLVARGNKPFLCFMVKIHDHEDSQRVAARHVKKSLLYDNTFLRDGVLSVRDNDLCMLPCPCIVNVYFYSRAVIVSPSFPWTLQRLILLMSVIQIVFAQESCTKMIFFVLRIL